MFYQTLQTLPVKYHAKAGILKHLSGCAYTIGRFEDLLQHNDEIRRRYCSNRPDHELRLTLNIEDSEVLANSGRLEEGLQRFQDAYQKYVIAEKSFINFEAKKHCVGNALLALNKPERAEKELQVALDKMRGYEQVSYKRIQIVNKLVDSMLMQGKHAAAADLLRHEIPICDSAIKGPMFALENLHRKYAELASAQGDQAVATFHRQRLASRRDFREKEIKRLRPRVAKILEAQLRRDDETK